MGKTPFKVLLVFLFVWIISTLIFVLGEEFARKYQQQQEDGKQNEFGDTLHSDDDLLHEKLKYTAAKQQYIHHETIGEKNTPLYENVDRLIRRDGVKVGHVEDVEIGEMKKVKVITRAMKPLLFDDWKLFGTNREIPNFLSDEECEHIINRAKDPKEGGMFMSYAKGGLTSNVTYVRKGVNGKSSGPLKLFEFWDCIHRDGKITVEEIITVVHRSVSMIFVETDVTDMFKVLENVEILNDGYITPNEFSNLSTLAVEHYLINLWENHPRFKTRTSEQAWLFMEQWVDPIIHNIRERLVRLTGLPRKIIYGGERLQVVHYYPDGHYHAHHDSETHKRSDLPCCHQYKGDIINSTGECKLCRFITFIMYLNDVEEGGATAFPVADDVVGYNAEQVRGNATSDKYNLSQGCKRANLLFKPKKGMAALWYNHLVNQTDGWMGELDLFSLHGGCDVIKGEKWISNIWIPAPFGKGKDIPSIYLNNEDYELAERKATQGEL